MQIEDLPKHVTLDYILSRCKECPVCGNITQWATRAARNQPLIDLKVGGKQRKLYVRRVVWRLAHPTGSMPNGKSSVVTSKCANPMCIDPEQVTATTRARAYKAHAERGTWSGPLASARNVRGAKQRNKLSDEAIREIFYSDQPIDTIAEEKGITASYVRMLKRGMWRRDITAPKNPFSGLLGLDR